MKAVGLCIVALECSQILYHALARPDLNGNLARTLVADAASTPPGGLDGPWGPSRAAGWRGLNHSGN